MAYNDFVQNIVNADIDAQALSAFMQQPSGNKVPRRLAAQINTLDYYLGFLRGLELVYSQASGTVSVNGVQVKTVTQAIKDAINNAGVANGVNANLVTFFSDLNGAVARTQSAKNTDFVSVKDFGAKGDGVTDDLTAINNALDFVESTGARLYFPSGVYRLSKTVLRRKPSTWLGDSAIEKNVGGSDGYRGSWLYFDHSDVGVKFTAEGGYYTGVSVAGFGIKRNQHEPQAGQAWTPINADFDFEIFGVPSSTFSDILLLRSCRGFYAHGDPQKGIGVGRLNLYRINGQVFNQLVKIDNCYDTPRIDQVHVWTFWRANQPVIDYMLANLDVIYLLRCDNPLLSNLFTIFARSAIRFGNSPDGGVSKLHLDNVDFDRGVNGLWFDSTTNGVTAQIDNYTSQCEITAGIGILNSGSNNHVQFGSVYIADAGKSAIQIDGDNNLFEISLLKIKEYDKSNTNAPAILVSTTSKLTVAQAPTITSETKNNPYSTTGNISVNAWRDFTPVVTSSTGAITNLEASGKYKIDGNIVTVDFTIKIVDKGTAGGDIRFNIPFGAKIAVSSVGSGREVAVVGKTLAVTALSQNNYIMINNYDNNFPAPANGVVLVGNIRYTI